MFKTLLKAEFDASKMYSYFFLAANMLCLVTGVVRDWSMNNLAAASLLVFWVSVIANYSSYSDQKRCRLYTQLPTTHLQVFLAGWAPALTWLGGSVSLWLLYGLLLDPVFSAARAIELVTGALGILMVTALVSIAIDLGAFRPRSVQWLYIISMALLIALAASLDISSHVGIRINEGSFSVFPFAFERFGLLGLLYAAAAAALVFFVDYKAYEKSDSYLH